jgi:formylglycine-generating enzyme required for sulfatase activity
VGNVWEWTATWDDFIEKSQSRVIMGAGWNIATQHYLDGNTRSSLAPTHRSPYTGFRCVRSE